MPKRSRGVAVYHHPKELDVLEDGRQVEVGECWSVSQNQVWVPGLYESEALARAAVKFPDRVLQRLQDAANARLGGFNGIITAEDLEAARKELELDENQKREV